MLWRRVGTTSSICFFFVCFVYLVISQSHDDDSRPAMPRPSSTRAANRQPGELKDVSDNKFPNIVFMLADDLGYGDVSYNGGNAKTPYLDAMADGPNTVHLTRYYSGSPVCSPTRGTVLTGRNHNRYCIWSANTGNGDDSRPQTMPLPPTEITVAEILKNQGYKTALFGKWHLGDFNQLPGGNKKWPVSHPGMHGFDEWWSTQRSGQNTNINCACFNESTTKGTCVSGHYESPPDCYNYYTIKDTESNTLESLGYPVIGDDSLFIVQNFERYLEQVNNTGKPFFVYLPFHTVHHRFVAAKEYSEKYRGKGYTLEKIDYYSSITAMDDAVGQVRYLLKKFNLSNNTMLWFTSDNGPEEYTPGVTAGLKERKRSLHEGGIRVPGLIEWPDMIKSNKKSSYPVVSNDFLPTVCDILGESPPSDRPIDGTSILPFLKGKTSSRNSPIKWAYSKEGIIEKEFKAAISDDRYKVHVTYNKEGKIETAKLYDIHEDPFEKRDISHNQQERFQTLKSELEEWRQSVVKSAKEEVECYGVSWAYVPPHV